MEQSAVLRPRPDRLNGLSVSRIVERLSRLGDRPALSDMGVSDRLVAEAALLSATPGREAWRPEIATTHPAGVLVALVGDGDDLSVILTRRTEHLKHHAGQISFPGGGAEPGDGSIDATAIREAREEVGLNPAGVRVLGHLPEYVTLSAYRITPVIAAVEPPEAFRPEPFEVAEVFMAPLSHLLDPANHQRHFREENGRRRGYYGIPWNNRLIWGATAGILVNFSHLMLAE